MKINYKDHPFKIFAAYIGRHKKMFFIDMGCAVAVSAIDLIFPYVSRLSMNELLPKNLFGTFFAVMAIMLLAYVLKAALYYVITYVGHHMGVLTESDMRQDLFNHMQELSFSFFDQNRTGVLLSRVTSDLFDITELAHHGPENILICSLTLVGSLLVMFSINWKLGLVLMVALPVCIAFTLVQRVKMKNANLEVKKKTAEIYAAIESSISGIRTAKAFANEEKENEKFEEANQQFRLSKLGYFKTMGLFMSGMEFTGSVSQVIIIGVGGLLLMKNQINLVDLITFSLYVSTFVSPIRKLAQFSEYYMQGMAGFTRFLELMNTEPDIVDEPDAKELKEVKGEIEYRDVSFAYSNDVPVLEGVNLHIKPGQTLAVVGPSGGGKTTLCQLLPRFYDVSSGSIEIDGQDIRSVTQQSLRRHVGIIQQDVFMFAGTVKDNIRYGRPDATDEEIVEAAVRAEIHKEIMEMPKGYDSYIGERGVMLSGGQKQRISIARVFLKNPRILVLDEATSALDTVTEQRIQNSLDELSKGRTSIIIAHRLSTVRNADIIAVIENENIVEMGSHKELMEKDGVYAQLVKAQSLKEE